jgi:hypothetical protein
MGVLPQDLEIIFEVQMKGSNEQIARRKTSFPTHKTRFFSFSFLFFATFKASNFLISNSLKTT